jgi:hypothetical protein
MVSKAREKMEGEIFGALYEASSIAFRVRAKSVFAQACRIPAFSTVIFCSAQ